MVVALDLSGLDVMDRLFPTSEFHLSVDAARAAIRSKSQFKLLDRVLRAVDEEGRSEVD